MKALSILFISMLAATAQAKTFTCTAQYPEQGQKANVTLDCDSEICSVSGVVSDENLSPSEPSLEDCDATRRPETTAARYKGTAFYDVKGDHCWANYIRVDKNLLNGAAEGYASLAQAGGGDHHDYSGYQYVYLKCH